MNICGPVLLYLGFSLVQIIIDIFKTMYNTALLKFTIMIVFSFVLNLLCQNNLTVISWIVVFVPFIFMTFITAILLFVFGMNPTQGMSTNTQINSCNDIIDEYTCIKNGCIWEQSANNGLGKCLNYNQAENILEKNELDINSNSASNMSSDTIKCKNIKNNYDCIENNCVWDQDTSTNLGKCITYKEAENNSNNGEGKCKNLSTSSECINNGCIWDKNKNNGNGKCMSYSNAENKIPNSGNIYCNELTNSSDCINVGCIWDKDEETGKSSCLTYQDAEELLKKNDVKIYNCGSYNENYKCLEGGCYWDEKMNNGYGGCTDDEFSINNNTQNSNKSSYSDSINSINVNNKSVNSMSVNNMSVNSMGVNSISTNNTKSTNNTNSTNNTTCPEYCMPPTEVTGNCYKVNNNSNYYTVCPYECKNDIDCLDSRDCSSCPSMLMFNSKDPLPEQPESMISNSDNLLTNDICYVKCLNSALVNRDKILSSDEVINRCEKQCNIEDVNNKN